MKIEIIPDQSFCARAGDKFVPGLRIASEWEGLRKLVDGNGRFLIADTDGTVFKGTPDLMHDLSVTVGPAEGFVQVPQVTLPTGQVVPAFLVGQYHSSTGADGKLAVGGIAKPTVNIKYSAARDACADAGGKLITELQWLAIAHDIAQQGINWTSGKVGQGSIFQGIHKGNVQGAQDGSHESKDEAERRWHQLSNGSRVYDFAGNVFSWVFDDLHGDDQGLVKGTIQSDSPSLKCAPAKSEQQGVGYVPNGPLSWSGRALIRGGCWDSDEDAGVFRLDSVWPDYDDFDVGFRCTK
jgi:formylglycine-generating enzyme required for sulfatase activity